MGVQKLCTAASAAVLAMCFASVSALAQDVPGSATESLGLDEIIVTASRTGSSRALDTPLALTALTNQQLEQRGIQDIRGLTDYTPGLQIADFAGYAQVFIRGIGSNDPFAGTDPSSTMHLDGVYLGRTLGYFSSFLDVERIEVLRGPQGMLYGRNSVGGTINVITRTPPEEMTAEMQASGGTHSTFGAQSYLGGDVGGGVRAGLALQYRRNGNYFENTSTGNDLGRERSFGVRGQVLIPLGLAEATFRADYAEQKGNLVGYSKLLEQTGHPGDDAVLGKARKVSLNRENHQDQSGGGISLELVAPLSNQITIKSLTSWRKLTGNLEYDSDASALDIGRTTVDLRQEQVSEDLSLTASFERLTVLAGLFYFHEKVREPLSFTLPDMGFTNFRLPEIKTRSLAAYAQAEYEITEPLSVVAGLRYTRERKRLGGRFLWTASGSLDFDTALAAPVVGTPLFYDPFAVDAAKTYDAWTPKFGINFRPNPDTLVYASATRGFKSGGYDMGATDPLTAETGFAPETLWSYEIGAKGSWLDRKLTLAVTGFRYDYKDLQVTLFVPPSYAVTQNAASARTYGVEIEAEAKVYEGLSLTGALSYLDATYRRYPGAYTAVFGAFDATGKRLNNAPEWSFMLGAQYSFEAAGGTAFLGADYKWQDRIYFSPANDGVNGVSGYLEQQGSYGLLNGRLGWTSSDGRYGVTLVGRNLLNQNYIVSTASYTAAISGRPGTPRTVELGLSMKW